jgi:hypothetical protein
MIHCSFLQFWGLNVSLKIDLQTKNARLAGEKNRSEDPACGGQAATTKEAIANANKEREGDNAIALFARIMD